METFKQMLHNEKLVKRRTSDAALYISTSWIFFITLWVNIYIKDKKENKKEKKRKERKKERIAA